MFIQFFFCPSVCYLGSCACKRKKIKQPKGPHQYNEPDNESTKSPLI